MIKAAGYVLHVPADRRETLLDAANEYKTVGEPVIAFDHSRRAPLIVFAAFTGRSITHIAQGEKGRPGSGGTGMIRLNLSDLAQIGPIRFASVLKRVPARFRRHVQRAFDGGGLLSEKSFPAVVDALLAIHPGLESRLARFSQRTAAVRITPRQRANLAVQKDTIAVALKIAGMDPEEVLEWTPGKDIQPESFLAGLPGAVLREDAMLIADFSQLPGFRAVRDYPFAAKEFVDSRDSRSKLFVFMANRLPLEEQTGADLIYYSETHRSFVLVQYKAMDRTGGQEAFRWRSGDQLAKEVAQMDELHRLLLACPDDPTPVSFRLHHNPFFLKVCKRQIFDLNDKGLLPGMYFPLELWKSMAADPSTRGPRGGRFINYGNAPRRLTNSEFVDLVTGGWIGTTAPQSKVLKRVIDYVIASGRTATFAVKVGPTVPRH